MATRQEWRRYLSCDYRDPVTPGRRYEQQEDKATRVATRIVEAIREYGPSREVIAELIRAAYGDNNGQA